MEFQTEAEIKEYAEKHLNMIDKPKEDPKPAFDPEAFKADLIAEIKKMNAENAHLDEDPKPEKTYMDAIASVI